MSLEGNLTAFGLSEILQLIAVQQKSGMLSIRSEERSKVLFFRNGNIISTRDRRRKTRDPLKDYLTRYGILSREDLIRLTQISAQSKLDLTDIIMSEGFLNEEDIKRHYRNHIQEEVHELLTWEQCSYKFIPGNDVIDGIRNLGEFSIEGMLMESMRRIDEFPQMLKVLPDLGSRIKKDGKAKDDVELTMNEKAALGLLSEERTLSFIITHGKMPRFDVYEAVKHLNEKGLVKIHVDTKQDSEDVKGAKTKKKRRGPTRNALPLMLSLVVFGLALYFGGKTVAPHLKSVITTGLAAPAASANGRNRVENELRWKIEAYRALNGKYPPTFSSLEKSGLIKKSFLEEIQRFKFRYRLTGSGDRYTLR